MAGWQYDSRNATLFPTRGTRFGLSFTASVPQSDVEYYVAGMDFSKYVPLVGRWLFRINSNLSYGSPYGSTTTGIPPFRNRYAGGPGSVAGSRKHARTEGFNGNPYGGNFLIANQLEIIVPTPAKIAGLDAHRALLRFGQRLLERRRRASTTSSATLSITISLMIN